MRKVYCDRCHKMIDEKCKYALSDKEKDVYPVTWLDCIYILLDEFDLCYFCRDQLIKIWQHAIKETDKNDNIKEEFENEKESEEKS